MLQAVIFTKIMVTLSVQTRWLNFTETSFSRKKKDFYKGFSLDATILHKSVQTTVLTHEEGLLGKEYSATKNVTKKLH